MLYEAIGIGRSVGLIAFPFACLFMGAARYAKRLYVEGRTRPGDEAQNTLIYGAGFLGNWPVHPDAAGSGVPRTSRSP